jgi:hypothetical protein
MTNVSPPPIIEPISDNSGIASLPWVSFFENLFIGDAGVAWNPTFVSLGSTGTPTITGRYYRVSAYITLFSVLITPATNTTSTAGSTYINNYPEIFTSDGICFAVAGGTGTNGGHIVAANQRIFTPVWSAVTVPVTIIGIGFTNG